MADKDKRGGGRDPAAILINGEEISVRALKKETVFFLQDMMVPRMTQYLFHVHNGDSGQHIEMEEQSMGETVKILVGTVMEELTSRAEETRKEITDHIL